MCHWKTALSAGRRRLGIVFYLIVLRGSELYGELEWWQPVALDCWCSH